MGKLLSLALILLSIQFSVCTDGTKSNKMLPVMIKGENGDSTRIVYDLENRIHKIIYLESYAHFKYSSDGKLERIEKNGHETYNFTYKNDSIFSVYTSTIDVIPNRTDTLIVNRQNQLIRKNSTNNMTRPDNVIYKYAGKGLLIESKSIFYTKYVFNSSSTTKYTYDSHKGIYSDINIESWILAYDILTLPVSLMENCVLEEDDIFGKLNSYTYTYNDDRYPITMKITGYRKWENITETVTITYKGIK